MSVVPQFPGEKNIKNRWPQDRPDKSGPSFWEWFQDSSASDAGCCLHEKTRQIDKKMKVYLWSIYGLYMAVCQNLVPLVNIKIAGKWMFIPLKMVCIGIDPYPYENKRDLLIPNISG